MQVHLAEDHRQRAADIVALTALARYSWHGVEADLSKLGALVASAVAAISPDELRKYSVMSWPEAACEIKAALATAHLAEQSEEIPPSTNRAARRAARAGKQR